MPQSIEQVLSDQPGEQLAQIKSGGDVVKPFLYAISRLADEARVHVDSDGLHVTQTDAANVAAVDIHLYENAFDAYGVDGETTAGVDIDRLRTHVKRARKRKNDQLCLTVREKELQTTVDRETDAVGALRFTNTLPTFDPNSVREPDIKTRPEGYDDLEFERLTLPSTDFFDAVSYIADEYEHVRLGSADGAFGLWNPGSKEAEISPSTAVFQDVAVGLDAKSLFSSDYLVDVVAGLKRAEADEVTVWWGDDIPMFVRGERLIDGNTVMDVTYMIAPRIGSDNEIN